jgi:glycerol-3-phosphate acyltransferase PlsY
MIDSEIRGRRRGRVVGEVGVLHIGLPKFLNFRGGKPDGTTVGLMAETRGV